MAENGMPAADGKWLSYKLEPADLAVHIPDRGDRMTVVWKGATDLDRLGEFFETNAKHLCGAERYSRIRFVMHEGEPQVFDLKPGPIGHISDRLNHAEFVRFECLRPETDPRNPVLVVFANLDGRAGSLADLHQSVGIHLHPRDYISKLDYEEIAGVVTSSHSDFFGPDRHYRRNAVLERLGDIRNDVKSTLAL